MFCKIIIISNEKFISYFGDFQAIASNRNKRKDGGANQKVCDVIY